MVIPFLIFAVVVIGPVAATASADGAKDSDLEGRRLHVHQQLAANQQVLAGASAGSAAQFRAKEERDRLVHEAVLLDELLFTERVFSEATPGSPAQFRARESADALRLKVHALPSPTR
jgi:hypothetical protein